MTTNATFRGFALAAFASVTLLAGSSPVLGGGGPENALLIIDPTSEDSLRVGNYYRFTRDIPDRNVIYMDPRASSYTDHVDFQRDALFGMLTHLNVADHIDYIIIPPGSNFYVPASGFVEDGCSSVNRFAISSAYGMAFLTDEILGGVPVTLENEYFAASFGSAIAFDSNIEWNNGVPLPGFPLARRYFIGAMLGYSGERGNTVEETIEMIDRSIAADGARPDGTFYFMKTNDQNRSGPRDPFFGATIRVINGSGGRAEQIDAVLPAGRHDVLGIMTGAASPDIDGTDMTILPGAFCDHLTSFAGRFDTSSQTKMSRWIANGASGSLGAVEEPCNYPGKFPVPRMHYHYFLGLSLGEAVFRNLAFVPFQMLIYGDPLTRPFAYLPSVSVPDAPEDVVSGQIFLTPEATTDNPRADIDGYDIYVDGVVLGHTEFGGQFLLDTTPWSDGAHDVRVVAFDDSTVASQGRWIGVIRTDNHGKSATLSVEPSSGDLATVFSFDLSAAGGNVEEIRLIVEGRVIASTTIENEVIELLGSDFGPGPVRVYAEAEFDDERRAISETLFVDVAQSGEPDPNPDPPFAFSYRKHVRHNVPTIIELPATNLDGRTLTYTIETLPEQATLDGTGPTRLLRPNPQARGLDEITFSVADDEDSSNIATIIVHYDHIPGDLDFDEDVDLDDYRLLQLCFNGENQPPADSCPVGVDADLDAEGDVDLLDLRQLFDNLTGPRPRSP